MSMFVSADTSWRFFGDELGIEALPERIAMFAVIEMALVACGYAMHRNVQATGEAGGAPRVLAWSLCGFSAYAALALSGPIAGIARVLLGPVLGVISLHMALGIELRKRRDAATTSTMARVLVEMRERLLSRLGLANEGRTAVALTRDRAARRAARLAKADKALFRNQRLARALRVSNVAHDEEQRIRLLDELAMLQHADDLAKLEQHSPWTSTSRGINEQIEAAEQRARDAEAAAAKAVETAREEAAQAQQQVRDLNSAVRQREAERERLQEQLRETEQILTTEDARTPEDWAMLRELLGQINLDVQGTTAVSRALRVSTRWVQKYAHSAVDQNSNDRQLTLAR
ncbi:hypothetical protein [Saccharopolyspora griseoalba]|uniref:Uncharacterized protein n=1 Tax=Saccharopolyspora griseoalba TaxID=1431848 RepID=A0ABW2LUR0_9PSEU